jgi:naphthoate synthase
LKAAFTARHGGVGGLGRISHDLLLRLYLDTDESKELGASMREKRKPDTDKFGH